MKKSCFSVRRFLKLLLAAAVLTAGILPAGCGTKQDPSVADVIVKSQEPLLIEVRAEDGSKLIYDSTAKSRDSDWCYDIVPDGRPLTEEEQDRLFPGLELITLQDTSGNYGEMPRAFFDPDNGELCMIRAMAERTIYVSNTTIVIGKKYAGTVCEVFEGKESMVYGVPVNAFVHSGTSSEDGTEHWSTICNTVFYLDDWYVWVQSIGMEKAEDAVRKNAKIVFRLICNGISAFDLDKGSAKGGMTAK